MPIEIAGPVVVGIILMFGALVFWATRNIKVPEEKGSIHRYDDADLEFDIREMERFLAGERYAPYDWKKDPSISGADYFRKD